MTSAPFGIWGSVDTVRASPGVASLRPRSPDECLVDVVHSSANGGRVLRELASLNHAGPSRAPEVRLSLKLKVHLLRSRARPSVLPAPSGFLLASSARA